MTKREKPVIHILILFCCLIIASSLSYSIAQAEEVRDSTSTEAGLPEGVPPPLSRNPFISAPYGRMDKRPLKEEAKPEIKTTEEKSGENSGDVENTGQKETTNRIEITNIIENKIEGTDEEHVLSDLKVTGVLLGGDDPRALLGDRVVKIGDKIGAHVITDITRRGILLSHGDKVVRIPFE